MAKKEKWVEFVEDINEALKLEPPYPTNDEEQTIADIVNRQEGDDAFVDEDYLPENGIGLKDSTVAWLMENDVELPKTWQKRFNKQQDKVKNMKKETLEESKPDKTAKKTDKTAKKTDKTATPEKKVEKVKKEKKAPAANRAKNELGHLIGSGADTLDKLFLQGVTEEELQAQGFTLGRYKSHYKHLEKDKADLVTVSWKNGKIVAKKVKGE